MRGWLTGWRGTEGSSAAGGCSALRHAPAPNHPPSSPHRPTHPSPCQVIRIQPNEGTCVNLLPPPHHPTHPSPRQVIRIQPNEGIFLKINNKVPGLGLRIDTTNLDLTYKAKYSGHLPGERAAAGRGACALRSLRRALGDVPALPRPAPDHAPPPSTPSLPRQTTRPPAKPPRRRVRAPDPGLHQRRPPPVHPQRRAGGGLGEVHARAQGGGSAGGGLGLVGVAGDGWSGQQGAGERLHICTAHWLVLRPLVDSSTCCPSSSVR